MSPETVRFVVVVIVSIVTSGTASVGIQYWRSDRKIKADAAKSEAEAQGVDVQAQSQIIKDLQGELSRLATRVTKLEGEIEKYGQLVLALRRALMEAITWMQKTWQILTPEQQRKVNPPPNDDHLLIP